MMLEKAVKGKSQKVVHRQQSSPNPTAQKPSNSQGTAAKRCKTLRRRHSFCTENGPSSNTATGVSPNHVFDIALVTSMCSSPKNDQCTAQIAPSQT